MASPQFFNPYDEERAAIERRRQMAAMLQQQANQPLETQMAGGWVVPTPPTQGLAKIAQALVGAYGQRKADDEVKSIGEKYRQELANALKEADKLARGTPELPAVNIPPDDAGGGPGREYQPAVAPNPQAGAMRLLESPHSTAQALGAAQYQKHLEDERRRAIMREVMGQNVPGAGTQPGAAPGQPGANPRGSFMGVHPAAAAFAASGDPSLARLGGMIQDANKPVPVAEGGSVYIPGQGPVFSRPKLGENVLPVYDQQGNIIGVRPMPGASQAAAQTAGAVTGAQEQQRAQLDMIPVPDGQGGTIMMPRAMAARLLGGQAPGVPLSAPPAPRAAPTTPTPPGMVIPPQVQAQRDAEARAIIAREGQPDGGGAIPSSVVLGRTPSAAEQARERKIAEGEAERALNQPQARRAVTSAQSKAQIVSAKIDEALKGVSWFTTGIPGQVQGAFAGTPAYNLQQSIDTVKANLGFQELQAMREASPTGGALGQVAVQELNYLQGAVASLNRGQSSEQLRANLQQVQTHFNNWKQAVEQSYREMYPGQQPPAPPPTPERRQGDRRGWSVQRID